jgi:hypothetical protein
VAAAVACASQQQPYSVVFARRYAPPAGWNAFTANANGADLQRLGLGSSSVSGGVLRLRTDDAAKADVAGGGVDGFGLAGGRPVAQAVVGSAEM